MSDKPVIHEVTQETCYMTSDGRKFVGPGAMCDAINHQHKVDFFTWCEKNICVGGEWSADMVAAEIMAHWNVSAK